MEEQKKNKNKNNGHKLSRVVFNSLKQNLFLLMAIGFLQADTEALWRWSSPPRRTAGTRRWASHLAPSSSRASSSRAETQGNLVGRACGNPAPPAPAPPGSPYLKGAAITLWELDIHDRCLFNIINNYKSGRKDKSGQSKCTWFWLHVFVFLLFKIHKLMSGINYVVFQTFLRGFRIFQHILGINTNVFYEFTADILTLVIL